MSRRLTWILLFVCTVHPFQLRGQTNLKQSSQERDIPALKEFERYVRTHMEHDRIPGMTIGFLQDGKTWVRAFGFSDVENRTPALPDSAYRIASTTKTMTGAAIVQLAERGKINLDAEIQTYLPDYPKQKWPVTVRQLLNHLGGDQGPSGLGPDQVSMKELVARISARQITVEPGTRFVYGTADYNLLAAAVENVTGGSFEKYLRENLWRPAGMNDTRIDDLRGLVPNRVRGYDLADGELKNAPFINVSSRIGGGGVTSTVPDMLRWAGALIEQKIVSPKWHQEMLRPATTTSGRWSGIGDADAYYTLGWMVRPANGNFVAEHGGSQKGTASAFFVFPEKRLAISVLSNLEFAPLDKYARQLFETITGEEWAISVATRDPALAPIARALDGAFNFGSLDYWQHHRATPDVQQLAEAFTYFNTNTSEEALRTDRSSTLRKIRDGRHPVAGNAFIRVGSYMAAKLVEQNGQAAFAKYFKTGAIPFFADYVRLYKKDSQIPTQFRFTPAFETLVDRWDGDWTRTWNDYTRNIELTATSDFMEIGARLRKEFSAAEVYPDFTSDLQRIQQGEAAITASKLGVDLYPNSEELLFNLGYFLIIAEQTEEGRTAVRKLIGDHERPIVYFRRAFEANPNGVMAAVTFVDLGTRWLRRPEMHSAATEFVSAGIILHPKNGALYELLGDLLFRKGQTDQAISNFRMAYQLDPKLAKGASVEEYVTARTKGN